MIYLDHAATTPLRPEVREAMLPWLGERWGNPSSAHGPGREARAALEEARHRLAAALGAERGEIVFTGGGTEADDTAVLGAWRYAAAAARESGAGLPPVACSAVEHPAVLRSAQQAAREGAEVLLLGVDEDGRVLEEAVEEVLAARPAVLSLMWGNNEVGTLQPVGEIARRCVESEVVYHTDAVQAVGKVPVRVDEVPCHLLSLSGHKLGGPQGAGALFVRRGTELEPLLHGGGQEGGLRSGTHNVAGAVGLAVAVELAAGEVAREEERLRGLRDSLEAGLRVRVEGLRVNAAGADRLPQTLSVRVPGVRPDEVLMALDLEGICVSAGSACQTGAVGPSHVLVAMGVAGAEDADEPSAVLRFSLGRTTTEADIAAVLDRLPTLLERLRGLAAV